MTKEETTFDNSRRSRFLVSILLRIRSIEGVDDIAALSQVLPGVLGPIASSTVLSLVTPFACIAAFGMKKEYEEICEEYDAILQRQLDTETKLRYLSEHSEKWRRFLASRLKLKIPEAASIPPKSNSNKPSLNHVAYLIAQQENHKNEALIAAIGKKYGWTGIAGMGGMSLAMLSAITETGIEIAEKAGETSTALAATADGLTIAAGLSFGIGQLGILAYASNRIRQGVITNNMLLNSSKNFRKYTSPLIDQQTSDAIEENLNKKIRFNHRANIQYGTVASIGQGFMLTSTVINLLPGIGTAVSIPLMAMGAPMAVGASIWRAIQDAKKKNFIGKGDNDYCKLRTDRTDLLTLFHDSMTADAAPPIPLILQDAFKTCSEQLAQVKLCSLLHKLLHSRKYATPEKKIERLDYLFRSNAIASSLKGQVLQQVEDLFQTKRDDITALFALPSIDADKILLANIIGIDEGHFDLRTTRHCTTEALTLLSTSLDLQDTSIIRKMGNVIADHEYQAFNALLLPKLKASLKYIRHDLADKLIQFAHIQEIKEHIQLEEQSLPKEPSSPRPSTTSFAAKIKDTQATAKHTHALTHRSTSATLLENSNAHYAHLKQILMQPSEELTTEIIENQQTTLDHFRAQSIPFSMAKNYTDAHGNIHIVWDTPNLALQGNPDYQITYIINQSTQKLTVLYGKNASAIVASDSNVMQNIGVRVLEIHQGHHSFLGDSKNSFIDAAKCHSGILKRAGSWADIAIRESSEVEQRSP